MPDHSNDLPDLHDPHDRRDPHDASDRHGRHDACAPHDPIGSREAHDACEAWARSAVERLVGVWRRLGVRYWRHLDRQALPVDALDDLLTLAARRELPLEPPRHRLLPRGGLPGTALAVTRLVRPDRQVLRTVMAGQASDITRQEHAAAALFRLALHARAARRWTDAPPVDTASAPGVGGF